MSNFKFHNFLLQILDMSWQERVDIFRNVRGVQRESRVVKNSQQILDDILAYFRIVWRQPLHYMNFYEIYNFYSNYLASFSWRKSTLH